ncbi:MAG: hypothetical protein AB8F78_13300 [Saprospiraceae bacterium]
MKISITSYLFIFFFSHSICYPELIAQVPAHHMTPGLPWTVVDESELPAEAFDSAYHNAIIDYIGDNAEIRYLFRVYFHPELTNLVDGKIYAEIPRDPGVSEIISWNRGRIDSSNVDGLGNSDRILYRGNESDHPSVSSNSIFALTYVIALDTSLSFYPEAYNGLIQFGPATYELFGGPKGAGAHRYGYFIQVVDSIWHPQVSSVREPLSSIQVKAYPNPCIDQYTIEIPELWQQKPSTLNILHGSTGQVVFQVELPLGQAEITLTEETLNNLAPGFYTAFIRREDGVGGVAATNLIKQ